ncbi:unnamed protein product [Jaminaea pallidilutea]
MSSQPSSPNSTSTSTSARHKFSSSIRSRWGHSRQSSRTSTKDVPEPYNTGERQAEEPASSPRTSGPSTTTRPSSSAPTHGTQTPTQDAAPASNPFSSEISLILTALVVTSTTALVLVHWHWSLSILAILLGAHVLGKVLQSKAADVDFAAKRSSVQQLLAEKDNAETVEWLNTVLASVWPLINADLFTPFVDLLEDTMQTIVPGIVHAVRIEDLDQGAVPITINSLKILPSDESAFLNKQGGDDPQAEREIEDELNDTEGKPNVDLGDYVNLEMSFTYRAPEHARKGATTKSGNVSKDEQVGNDEAGEGQQRANDTSVHQRQHHDGETPLETVHLLIYMAIGLQKIAAVEVPVWVEMVGIEAKLRLRLQLVPALPFVKHVGFTLLEQPKLELKAKPLGKRMIIDAMNLPLLSSYVLRSVQTTVQPFIAPASYTVDVAGLLGAGDGPKNTYAVGVICVVIHSATDLPAADVNGLADPFVTVSFARVGKPLFRTRVLRRNTNPRWGEVAYLLVSPDEVRDHDRLRLTVFDADRFSADDPLGKIEISIDRLIQKSLYRDRDFDSCAMMETRESPLAPMRKGGKASGSLRYSVVFARLVQQEGMDAPMASPARSLMMQEAAHRGKQQMEEGEEEPINKDANTLAADGAQQGQVRSSDQTTTEASTSQAPSPQLYPFETGFDRFIRSLGLPLDNSILLARKERRDRVRKLTGLIAGEEAAVAHPPAEDWPSGILAFHIHSIQSLEVGRTQRSLGSSKGVAASLLTSGSRNSATGGAGGSAAEDESGDPVSGAEGMGKLPSSYVQVLLNDEAVLSTRVKTLNPRPFFNAGSERFVPDFTRGRIDFVVRDRRQRESDAILGVVAIDLREALKHSARWTGVHTLTGGLGVGKLRISLVWRSIHLCVPRPLRGYNVGILEVAGLKAVLDDGIHRDWFEGKEAHWVLDGRWGRNETESLKPNNEDGSPRYEISFGTSKEAGPMRLPVRSRYPSSLILTLRSTHRVPGRHRKRAMASLPLDRTVVDGQIHTMTVPLWGTSDAPAVEEIMRDAAVDHAVQGEANHKRNPALFDLVKAPLYPDEDSVTLPSSIAALGAVAQSSSAVAGATAAPVAVSRGNGEGGEDGEQENTDSAAPRRRSSSQSKSRFFGHSRTSSNASASRRSSDAGSSSRLAQLQRIGEVTATVAFFPGVAEEHRGLTAGDHELRVAYEAWSVLRDCNERGKEGRIGATGSSGKARANGEPERGLAPWDGKFMSSGTYQSQERLGGVEAVTERDQSHEDGQAGPSERKVSHANNDDDENDSDDFYDNGYGEDDDEYDDTGAMAGEASGSSPSPHSRSQRRRQMHRQEAGAAQMKSYRTFSWIKQNVQDGVARVSNKGQRMSGGVGSKAEKRLGKMEKEGISSF